MKKNYNLENLKKYFMEKDKAREESIYPFLGFTELLLNLGGTATLSEICQRIRTIKEGDSGVGDLELRISKEWNAIENAEFVLKDDLKVFKDETEIPEGWTPPEDFNNIIAPKGGNISFKNYIEFIVDGLTLMFEAKGFLEVERYASFNKKVSFTKKFYGLVG